MIINPVLNGIHRSNKYCELDKIPIGVHLEIVDGTQKGLVEVILETVKVSKFDSLYTDSMSRTPLLNITMSSNNNERVCRYQVHHSMYPVRKNTKYRGIIELLDLVSINIGLDP